MTRTELIAFLRRYKLAVEASIAVRPRWVRYSDFTCTPPRIVELDAAALA